MRREQPSSRRPDSRRRQPNTGFVEKRIPWMPLEREPWKPAPYDRADVAAFRAFADGRAEPYQQALVLDWILKACGTSENPFRPGQDGARDTDFASGKQFIGQQILKLMHLRWPDEDQGEQG